MTQVRQHRTVGGGTRRLISSGVDGAVYEWRVATMRRERENVLKVIANLQSIHPSSAVPHCRCHDLIDR